MIEAQTRIKPAEIKAIIQKLINLAKFVITLPLSARVIGSEGNYSVEPENEAEERVMGNVEIGAFIAEAPGDQFTNIPTYEEAKGVANWLTERASEEAASQN